MKTRGNNLGYRLSIILVIVVTFLLGVIIRVDKLYKDQIYKNNTLIKENIIYKEELEKMQKSLEENKAKIEELEKEQHNLLNQYKELNEKYQEEIKPVSYNKDNLLSPSGATVNKLKYALIGTGLNGLEDSYIQAEKEYGINAIFLVSLTAEESAWGTSNRAINQNNMSGFEVYNPSAKGAIFSSKHESIMTTARLLKNSYLTEGAIYHYGYSIYAVNEKYCASGGYSWSNNISSIANSLVEKINNR